MTQSGALNKRIQLGNVKNVTDDEGFQSREFVQIAKPWAKVAPVTEQISINDEKENVAKERATFEIYYREGVTKNMSVKFQDKVYNITGIFNPNFENVMLILTGERDTSLITTTTTTTLPPEK